MHVHAWMWISANWGCRLWRCRWRPHELARTGATHGIFRTTPRRVMRIWPHPLPARTHVVWTGLCGICCWSMQHAACCHTCVARPGDPWVLPYAGPLVDRYGGRALLLVSFAASVVSYSLTAMASNIWLLYLSR